LASGHRSVEDKLSDAMHERLIERFVDRRTSVLMRRLRENTTLETEIKKTGEVVVEGHDIGRLDGFTFVADASAAGSEAKTLQGAARSALAGEIDARATKVTQAPDREFVLASDGSVRWTGAPVGKLIAGDDVLRPRLPCHRRRATHRRVARGGADAARSLARESHRAAARSACSRWRGRRHHRHRARRCLPVDRVDRRAGAAEGAEDVKGLDQPSRAVLRKYGVRFGAYHLYLPALLKPAPRSLAAQLWMLKHGGPGRQGPRRSAAARFERPHLDPGRQGHAEAALPHHRLSRVRRARHPRRYPERLADLIRPALAWREGASGVKPAGAFNGFGFTVTGAMTSLTGASGEDFASILRLARLSHGEAAKPPEPEPAATSAEPEATAAPVAADAAPETPAEARPDLRRTDWRARSDIGAGC
jgi:ATP-dependent RNA helicase SUPV3L1/SUV3